MRKIFYLFYLFTLLHLSTFAQVSISFNMHYLPMREYNLTASQQLKSTTTFSGDDSLLTLLKDRGIDNPKIVTRGISAVGKTVTGAYNNKNEMPVRLTFLKLADAQGNSLIQPGSGLVGKIEKDKMPAYDSVIVTDASDTVSKKALNQLKTIFSQIHLPAAKMKLGDEYVYTTPFSMPVGAVVMKMIMSITYHLRTVTDSVAGFDLTMKMNFDIGMDSVEKKQRGSGSGSGTMIYDRINSFPLKEEMHYTLQMAVENKGIKIEVEIKSNSLHNYTITKLQVPTKENK